MAESLELGFTAVILMTLSSGVLTKAGSQMTAVIETVQFLSANHGPIFNDQVASISVTVGQTAWLPCNALNRGNHKIVWMNPKKIVFAMDELIVVEDKRIRVESSLHGDWNVRIEHVRYNDSGQYQCVINTTPVKIKYVHLHVQVPPHILHDQSSRDIEVEEGSNVQLQCKATGAPAPNITWYKRTQSAMHVRENLKHQGEVLNITHIQRYQWGTYICHADNGVQPSASRQMLINVQYVPVVKVLNKRLGQVFGLGTVLECNVKSYPKAKMYWYKNGYPIKHSFKYRLEVYRGEPNEFSLALEIPKLYKNDFGEYTCHAQNRMGNDSATMILYEYREPTRPTTPTTTTEDNQYGDHPQYPDKGETRKEIYPDHTGRNNRKYPTGDFRTGSDSHGSNRPYYQPTSSGSKSGLHTVTPIFVLYTVIFTYAGHL